MAPAPERRTRRAPTTISTLLVFSLTLFTAVLGSRLAERTIASAPVLAIAVGVVLGGGLDWLHFSSGDRATERLAT